MNAIDLMIISIISLELSFTVQLYMRMILFYDEFQKQEEINKEAVYQLIKQLRYNTHREVGYRL